MPKKLLSLALLFLVGVVFCNWPTAVRNPAASAPAPSPAAEPATSLPAAEPTAAAPATPISASLADIASNPAPLQADPAPIIAFRSWAADYLVAPPSQQPTILSQCVKLAQAHTREIAMMIRQYPQQAIANAVPMVICQNLPTSIVSLLEKRVSMMASLNVYGNVPVPDTEVPPEFKPYTRSATKEDGSFWNAYVYGARASHHR